MNTRRDVRMKPSANARPVPEHRNETRHDGKSRSTGCGAPGPDLHGICAEPFRRARARCPVANTSHRKTSDPDPRWIACASLSTLVPAAAVHAQEPAGPPTPPPFTAQRFAEDYSHLRGPASRVVAGGQLDAARRVERVELQRPPPCAGAV